MKKNEREAIVWLFGIVGVLFILVGIFSTALDFTTGLLIAIVCWIIAGFIKRAWKVKKMAPVKKPAKKKARRKRRR